MFRTKNRKKPHERDNIGVFSTWLFQLYGGPLNTELFYADISWKEKDGHLHTSIENQRKKSIICDGK